ncbi:phage minor head protein [Orbaceae bacterium ac157xtp]
MKKKKTLKINSIRPSSIVENNYRKNLIHIIHLTKKDIQKITQDYAKAKTDAHYVNEISERFGQAINEWGNSFNEKAIELATNFANDSLKTVDRSLKANFRKNDLSINFQMTKSMQAKIESKIAENVGLIRSIPSEYLNETLGVVMRCIERGNDLKTLSEVLEYRFGVTERRAKLIAKDQANKATVAFNRQRQIDLGIKKGVWVHSGLGKNKRASHVKAGREKLIFDLEKGALIDGEYILPGELINCHCTWRSVLFDE